MPKHIVIFSHGFGVRNDSRGMFTEIAAALSPGTEKVLFDYNRRDESTHTLTVGTMDQWIKKLKQVIADIRAKNPDAIIDLICHSQGCIVAGFVKPMGLRKIILLGPPATLDPERFSRIFTQPGTHVDLNGTSRLARRDGSTTIVPKEYWTSISNLDPIALYNSLVDVAKVVAIHAEKDEVIGSLDFSSLNPKIKQITIPNANHNFTDTTRKHLLLAIHKEMERNPVVNENDEIINHKFRDEITLDDIYRVSALWVKNSNGDILLAQRSLAKHHDPGKWGPAVAGTVEEGETYEQNIIKEAEEEIGLQDIKPGTGVKRRVTDNIPWKYFATTFTVVVDKPSKDFKFDEREIAQVKWFTRAELEQELKDHPESYLAAVPWGLKEL